MEYTAIIKEIEDGWYMGQCEQVPGAMTQGQTVEEVKENLKEVIPLILECEKELCQKRHKGEKFIRRQIAVL
ncbi:MAG: type II toxin-antitoxin system HicB family antitoxin [Bacteroidales bacterium]|jgi:predicted RNase H-like HicB family nuclease|nr:type II toxin-antitoxin system HicB family antitoxin [Bacteroidales bacterium]